MSVQIIWSLTNGGTGLDEPIDHGNNISGNTLSPKTVFIRHTGANPITGCAFYLRQFVGTSLTPAESYTGADSPINDFNELIAWGDDADEDDFGGFQINMNAVATPTFPTASWPTFADKNSTDLFGYTFRTSFGALEANAITLKKQMYNAGGVDGEIPTGAAPNVRFQARIVVPTNEAVPGVRLFEQVLKFTYTS